MSTQNAPSFADLRLHYHTGRSYTISGTGRDRIVRYRSGVQCNLGDIEVGEWRSMVHAAIEQAGEQELFHQLLTHMKEHDYTGSTKAQLENEALELHASRIFDDPLWVDFIPFNKQYRPDVLAATKQVLVVPECCEKAGYMTEARYRDCTLQGENFCPHCGRWKKIRLSIEPEEQIRINQTHNIGEYKV